MEYVECELLSFELNNAIEINTLMMNVTTQRATPTIARTLATLIFFVVTSACILILLFRTKTTTAYDIVQIK